MKRPCCVPIVCILYYSSTQALHTLEYSTLLALDSVLNLSWTSAAPFYARLQLPVLARSAQTILNGASQNEIHEAVRTNVHTNRAPLSVWEGYLRRVLLANLPHTLIGKPRRYCTVVS